MKKLLPLFLLALCLFGCSGDDSGSNSKAKPTSVLYELQGLFSKTNYFTYDSKSRISTVSDGQHLSTISYNPDNSVDEIVGPDLFYKFNYDQSKKLISLTDADENLIPVQSPSNGVRIIEGQTFSTNSSGDWTLVDGITFTYGSKKGAFANVKNVDALAIWLVENMSTVYLSKKRMATGSANGSNWTFDVTTEEKGLPKTAMSGDVSVVFTYSE
ncbi:hypothetical protein [Flavobacterium sp.]|uniref:hypothetical protein n=1 Tax=Flavobacterium sp. TaxID=239 RepID=UPI00121B35A7|nr:hypothetical protein [Flavobacterium sp.]RZJ72877.1 MAG: hypothetical protein EOO49_04385 [Flavobacterium sp.]